MCVCVRMHACVYMHACMHVQLSLHVCVLSSPVVSWKCSDFCDTEVGLRSDRGKTKGKRHTRYCPAQSVHAGREKGRGGREERGEGEEREERRGGEERRRERMGEERGKGVRGEGEERGEAGEGKEGRVTSPSLFLISAGLLHGDMDQGERDKVILGFKKGSFPVLVATDVAG